MARHFSHRHPDPVPSFSYDDDDDDDVIMTADLLGHRHERHNSHQPRQTSNEEDIYIYTVALAPIASFIHQLKADSFWPRAPKIPQMTFWRSAHPSGTSTMPSASASGLAHLFSCSIHTFYACDHPGMMHAISPAIFKSHRAEESHVFRPRGTRTHPSPDPGCAVIPTMR